MNDSELRFYNWLINSKNVSKENILINQNSSPDFVVKEGEQEVGYEVKLVKHKVISIHNTQHERIIKSKRKTYIVVMKPGFNDKPTCFIPYENIKDSKTQRLQGYKISIARLKNRVISGNSTLIQIWKRLCNDPKEASKRFNKLLIKDSLYLDKKYKKNFGFSLIKRYKDSIGEGYPKEEFDKIFGKIIKNGAVITVKTDEKM